MTPQSIRHSFFSVLNDVEKDIANYVNKPGSDMTRHRKCSFVDTVIATLCFSMNRTNTELFHFFGIHNRSVPSKSAFTQQRKKLNSDFFPHLLDSFNNVIPFTKTYNGFHLVAVDGSDLNLPTDKNDFVYRVKQARSDNYFFQMHINALYDICENRYVTAITQPRPELNESKAFCQMVDQCSMPYNTVFIADRGYVSINTIAHLLDSNKFFLIRAKAPSTSGSFLKYVIDAEKESDQEISLGITRSKNREYLNNPSKYKIIKYGRIFEPIPPEDHESVYAMNIRCTCIKLGDDTYEYLISNLPADIFSPEDLRELYWKRWSIETSFRSLKYALSLVYLHSVNRELIIQEVYAKLIMYNFASLLHAYATRVKKTSENDKNTKYEYKVSFDDTIPIAKELLKGGLKKSMIKALLLSHLTAIKRKNSSARRVRSQTVKSLNNRA